MKIATIFGSQRQGGVHSEIEAMLNGLHLEHEFDFIPMSDYRIEGCVACGSCVEGRCILPPSPTDDFQQIFDRLLAADVLLVITPVYAPIPSRLTALMERLLSISFYTHEIGQRERPLKGKKAAIITYYTGKIGDDTQIKLIFQRFLMDGYSFTEVNYDYLNSVTDPNEKYPNVAAYVKDVVLHF